MIYAGSLVNPALLELCPEDCRIFDSARMTLEEVIQVMEERHEAGQDVVRLHTGDPSLYGAIRSRWTGWMSCPSPMRCVSRRQLLFRGGCGPGGLSTLCRAFPRAWVITRMEGRTPVPEREKIQSFAAHQSTMVLF